MKGVSVVGFEDGLPGATVGPAVVGRFIVGNAAVGTADGLPKATVDPKVVGASLEGM